MCYLFLILRVFLKRKFQPKNMLKRIVFFIYSIDYIPPGIIVCEPKANTRCENIVMEN